MSWSRNLIKKLKSSKTDFDKNKIRISQYRPFFKQYFYFDNFYIENPGLFSKFFPEKNSENLIISVPSKGDIEKFSTLITNTITDYHVLFNSMCFPLYVYESEKRERKENITDET